MEEMSEIVWVIIVVFGILQIILFFKIWGMTNNISTMTEYMSGKKLLQQYMDKAEIEIVKGNKKKALELLNVAAHLSASKEIGKEIVSQERYDKLTEQAEELKD